MPLPIVPHLKTSMTDLGPTLRSPRPGRCYPQTKGEAGKFGESADLIRYPSQGKLTQLWNSLTINFNDLTV